MKPLAKLSFSLKETRGKFEKKRRENGLHNLGS